MNTPITNDANARALQALYDFIASAQVVSDYLESAAGTPALAQNLRVAKSEVEKPTQRLFALMAKDGLELIDPATGATCGADAYDADPAKYYLACVEDDGYLATGDHLERFRDVLTSLYEAVQLSLVAVRADLLEMNRDYCIALAFILKQTVFFSNVLRLIMSSVGHPDLRVFIPDDYEDRNPSYHITGLEGYDGISKKYPIPFEGDLFFPNEKGDVPAGSMTVDKFGHGTAYSIRSNEDMNEIMRIYLETCQKWVGGLS